MSNGLPITFLAFKALCLCQDLNTTERRVLAALLEHFNRKTAQCDPSVERIATLLGVSRRAVFRALNSLVSKGYLTRVSHGGYSHRNKYIPKWDFYLGVIEGWKRRWAALSRNRAAPSMTPFVGQDRHVADAKVVTQTYSNKQLQITLDGKTLSKPTPPAPYDLAQSILKFRHPTRDQRPPRFAEVAIASAERRWTTELTEIFKDEPELFGEVLDAITEEMRAAATDAEVRRRGTGLPLIVRQIPHLWRKGSQDPGKE
jgi:predicted transcriptional regulator